MLPASPTVHKTPTKHKISDNAIANIQSRIDIIKEEIEKTNTYCTEFKDVKIIRNLNIKVFLKEMKMFYSKRKTSV